MSILLRDDGLVGADEALVAFGLAEAGALPSPATLLAVWRAPERVDASADWTQSGVPMIDVSPFGETGLVALRRGGDGKPVLLPLGSVLALAATGGIGPLHW